MPSPTAKTTAASASSPASSPAQAQRPAARTSKRTASSARVHIRTKIPKVPAKRKRPLMPKEQSKNKKNWARGAREDILYAHLPKYTEELAKGGKGAAEYAVKICHELNYKIPYDMPDWKDPDTIPEYDHENPPPLPKLSDEKKKERAAALRVRNKRVINWLNYRARKVVSAIPKGSTDVNNAFALWMMRLTGTSGAPKKARQGWQQYQHENPELVQESAQRAWDARQEAGGGDDSSDESDDEEEEEAEEAEVDVDEGTKKQVKGVGFISKHARKLFDKLPLEERRALKARAKAEKEAAKELWDKAIKAPPSQHPQDVQAARDALPSFLNPILDGINRNAGDAHVYVLVGGRDPSRGGAVTVQHYDIGTNKDNVFFRDWDPQRLNRDVLTFFGEYLSTVWDDDECARMALGNEPGEDGEEGSGGEDGKGSCGAGGGNIFEDARYRFDKTSKQGDDVDSGEGGEDAGNGGEGGSSGGSEGGENVGSEGGENGGGENGGGEDGDGEDEEYHGEGDDDVDPRPSKRRRVRKDISPVVEDGAPPTTSSAGTMHEQPSSRPPRPKPKPTRRSTRNAKATARQSTSPAAATASPSARDLDGLIIDPVLLAPPYVQTERPPSKAPAAGASNTLVDEANAAQSASSPCPPSAAVTPSTELDHVPAPLAAASRPAITPPSTRSMRAPFGEGIAAAFPDAPDGAEPWFVSALGILRVELGEEWTRLLQSWARYEIRHDYGRSLPARNSRLDGAKSRPKEVGAWIGGGRWRSPGCEPTKKNGKFALTLLQSWWAWYVKLAPEWREEDEEGRLEDFAEFGEGMGKLDVPGVNGVLSLVVCLKWVGEALVSGTDIHDRVGVDRSWRRATTDLAKMLEGFESS